MSGAAAVLHAEAVLEPLDFASIGTNDLTEHLLAADGQEGLPADLEHPSPPPALAGTDLVTRAPAPALGRERSAA